jgi:hypothetical protein
VTMPWCSNKVLKTYAVGQSARYACKTPLM